MSAESYRIIDEPGDSALGNAATDPMWPLLASMLVGTWFGLCWFAFNAFALGSPRRWGDVIVAAVALAGAAALVLLIAVATGKGWITEAAAPYALLLVVAWKLAACYLLAQRQWPVAELRAWFGGTVRNGALVLLAGIFVARPAFRGLELHALIEATLS